MNYLLIALTTFIVAVSLNFLALKLWPKLGLMDRPFKYGLNRDPIPYYGGIMIVLAFFIVAFAFVGFSWNLVVFFGAAAIIALMGFFDDYLGLSPLFRLFIQIAAACLVFFAGIKIDFINLPVFGQLDLKILSFAGVSFLSLFITVFWFVFLINVYNWIDGLNGLASGIGTIASFTIFFLSIRPDFHYLDQGLLSVLVLILAVILLAFWFFDFYPAKMLMGDTGSMFIGFMLAGFSVLAGAKLATVLLVLGLPVLDAVWVIFRRILAGGSPFKGDRYHMHHRLLYFGLSNRQALLVYYSISLLLGIMAVFLGTTEKIWAFILLIFFLALFGFVLIYKNLQDQNKN